MIEIDDVINANHKAGIRIYPVIEGFSFKIEIVGLGLKKTGSKLFSTKNINAALIETHRYYYGKVIDQQKKNEFKS